MPSSYGKNSVATEIVLPMKTWKNCFPKHLLTSGQCHKMKDLSSVQQRADEKYRSFEIRVRKMVDDIFNLKLSAEEMTRLFVFQGLKCDKLRESFAVDPSLSDDRRRELASNLEKLTVRQEINAVKPKYADMVSRNTKPEYARQFTQPSHSVRQPSRIPVRLQPIVGNNDCFLIIDICVTQPHLEISLKIDMVRIIGLRDL